jgi:hypothetical protein
MDLARILDIAARIGHALRLTPALLRRDPIFRYAAIGALMALIVLVGRAAQDWAGPGPIPATPASAIELPSATGPAAPALPQPTPAAAPAIAPSRSLEGVTIAPAPADAFGRLPQH